MRAFTLIHRAISCASVVVLSLAYSAQAQTAQIKLYADLDDGPTQFAVSEIASAARARGHTVEKAALNQFSARSSSPQIIITSSKHREAVRQLEKLSAAALQPMKSEGFSVHVEQVAARRIWIAGHDSGGAMYGGLEVAEQLRLNDLEGVQPLARNPYMSMRGTKFNIPLDVRTPSYSDMSDAGQANIEQVWSWDFWTEYLDTLAKYRYNYVSLWNMHPFPSLVRVPEYPDIALDDVKRSKIRFDEDYPTIATDLVTPPMLANSETLKKLTIEEKIDFWRRVMQYAKDRNIDFYIITWNVYTYGVDGKYGITDSLNNKHTIDYFRKSVRELFRTYPLLRGVGLTTGENMGEDDFQAKEDWAFATYGQGVLDAARAEPTREIRLIHRQHQTRAQDIARTFAPVRAQPNVDFVFSFKYAQAHALSSTTQTFHHGYIESLGDLKTIWTLRNDDALMFRWGGADFVREFIKNIPYEPSQGYYLGSDMWVWGRDFLSRNASKPRELEIERHWYHWLLWGRLGYDPALDNARLIALISDRYRGVDAKALFDTWQHASMVYPLTTGFHWADFDFQWYIEGCRSRPAPAQTESGFHDVNRFITLGTHPGTDNIAIPRYVESIIQKQRLSGTSPYEAAAKLDRTADAAIRGLEHLRDDTTHDDKLAQLLSDMRAMALLGKYYASKIRGATELALFRRTGESNHQRRAVAELTDAQTHWLQYTALAASKYKNPLWTNRVGHVDWRELNGEVARDIEIARGPI